jgi:hypothetical protein
VPDTLAQLAKKIIAEHDAARRSTRDSVDHALAAGGFFLEAKKLVAHGGWLPWLDRNFRDRIAVRTVQAYMRLAELWPHYPQQLRNDVAYLPLREVINRFATRSTRPRPGNTQNANSTYVAIDYACPCGCGFEWRGDARPAARRGPLANLIAELAPLRRDQVEEVRAFVRSLAEQLQEEVA